MCLARVSDSQGAGVGTLHAFGVGAVGMLKGHLTDMLTLADTQEAAALSGPM